MQKITSKQSHNKDIKSNKLTTNTSKNKKQLKQSSSKNIKTIKSINQKTQLTAQESKVKQSISPSNTARSKQIQNDYGVNPYYAKYKVKTTRKKQSQGNTQPNQYGNMGSSKESFNKSTFDNGNQKNNRITGEESDYVSNAFQKLKIPNNRGVINAQGKFVPIKTQKQVSSQSFQHKSMTKNSFSLNFTSKDDSKSKKVGKSKSKRKRKIEQQKSVEYKIKHKSLDRLHVKEHISYYQKSRQQKHPKKVTKLKQKSIKQIVPSIKIDSTNSKATSTGTQLEIYSILGLIQDNSFVQQVKESITQEIENCKATSCLIKKNKQTQQILKQRLKCVQMLSKICGVMNMKRQTFSLAVFYLDKFLIDFSYSSMKLVALSSLTLALKMDDAEMISKFCFHYLFNPERTVKKSGSNHLKIKQKRQSVVQPKEEARQFKMKLAAMISSKISEQKRIIKQEFELQQVLDFQNQIMLKFGFKLVTKTMTYWIDLLTTLWDSFVGQFHSEFFDTLVFRNDKFPRNFSYLVQLLQFQEFTMGMYGHSKVALVLAAMYLIARIGLQQKKQETPWEQLCRYYKVSLSKTTNVIFCDGIGINSIFGDFLTLFELSMSNIISQIQAFSRYLQPSLIKVHEYRKIQGLNREDRLSIYIHPEQCFKYLGI